MDDKFPASGLPQADIAALNHAAVREHDDARIRTELARAARGGDDPFAEAVRTTRMPMIITDPRQPDNPAVFVNDAFCRLTGYGRAEILGRNCRFLQGRETAPESVARIRAAVAAAEPLELDILNYRKGGEKFWNRLLLAPVRDTDGELAYFFASQVDVTAERERLAGLESHNAALMAELAGHLHAQQASEARLRFAAQAGRMGIWELELRSGELTTSPEAREIFGCDRDRPMSQAQKLAAIHPEDRPKRDAAFAHAIRTGADYDIEYRVRPAEGRPRWVHVRAQLVRAPDGTPIRIAGMAMDITARRDAEERLQLSEESLRLATEAGGIGTWDIDLARQRISLSDKARAMFGIDRSAPLRLEEFFADLPAADAAMVREELAQAIDPAIRAPFDVEFSAGGSDGRPRRWLATRGKAIFARTGHCTRAIGTVIDVTPRRAAEARQAFLLGLWDQLRTLTDPRRIMSVAVTALGRHLQVNRAGYAQIQPDENQLLLEFGFHAGVAPLEGVFPIGRFGRNYLAMQEAGETLIRTDLHGEPPEVARGLAALDVGAMVSVPLIRDGNLFAALYVSTREPRSWTMDEVTLVEDVAARTWDAVERARAETALREANESLEQRIEAALAEQARVEEALRQAQKMEAVGQLTGGIAHDFNNLLAGIMGSLEMLQRRIATDQRGGVERYASAAMTSAQRATALTQRLLAFARRQPLDPKRIDANRLLAGMEDLLRRTLGPAINLELVMAGGLWPTLCDANQLDSAILNLAINARDAMPQGGRLVIETANAWLDEAYAARQGGEVRPGQYVCVAVTDTGTGMTQDVIEKAFDPFFTTKPTGQGTGLGLSMVYGFVKQSEGHVAIYSEPGHGTTFRLYLPRFGGNTKEDDETHMTDDKALQAETGETVLVVDDEATVRMLVTETLEELGYAAIEAGDAQAGLQILQSGARVDLLVTDVGLPGLNGRQFAEAGRALRPGLKVLFMTGYAHNAAIGSGAALEPGMEIITKPFALEALAKKIRDMIEGE